VIRFATLFLVWLAAGCSLLGPRSSVALEREEQSTPSGLRYLELMEGVGPSVADGDRVRIEYEARLEDGTRIDSTLERGLPLQLRVGEAPLTGMNEGLIGMRPGGKRRLVIPASLAYGDEGVPGLVPGGATIVIEVELLRRFED
jgi:peptidylprolyl isomerase